MDIRSILVNVDLAAPDSAALRYGVDLASTLGASITGVAADQPGVAAAGWGGEAAALDIYSAEREEIEAQLKRAEEAFQALVPSTIKRNWRGYLANRTQAVIETARMADLIITASKTTSPLQQRQTTDLGSLVLSSGRPVIDVAAGATVARFDTICIGWKDTREARRAVSDALPLLKLAGEVLAVTVTEGEQSAERASLDDLRAWLSTHDVSAKSEVLNNPGGYPDVLENRALALEADLLVTGGYGHSRMREWLFGGVTRSILEANTLNRFLSN